MPVIRQSIIEDVHYLADRLRQADIDELSVHGLTPFQSLMSGYRCSDVCYSILNDENEVMAIFGTCTVPEIEECYASTIWLLASLEIEKHKMFFLRNSRKWLETLIEPYDIVFNAVDTRNELHISWIKWLGFNFTDDTEINGYTFKQFYLDVNFNEVT
jgi:hypothetical protein